MTTNELKKALYKEKPIARMIMEGESPEGTEYTYWYGTQLADETVVTFKVPRSEMGENEFEKEVPAQLLIRWMQDGYTFSEPDEDGAVRVGMTMDDESIFPTEDDTSIGGQ